MARTSLSSTNLGGIGALTDSSILVQALSINKTLNKAIEDGDISTSNAIQKYTDTAIASIVNNLGIQIQHNLDVAKEHATSETNNVTRSLKEYVDGQIATSTIKANQYTDTQLVPLSTIIEDKELVTKDYAKNNFIDSNTTQVITGYKEFAYDICGKNTAGLANYFPNPLALNPTTWTTYAAGLDGFVMSGTLMSGSSYHQIRKTAQIPSGQIGMQFEIPQSLVGRYFAISFDTETNIIGSPSQYTDAALKAEIYDGCKSLLIDCGSNIIRSGTGKVSFTVMIKDLNKNGVPKYDFRLILDPAINCKDAFYIGIDNVSIVPIPMTSLDTIWDSSNKSLTAASLKLTELPIYESNADAISGGLSVGTLYRTGGDPSHLCIVN